MSRIIRDAARLDLVIEPILEAGRVPGAAIAVVVDGRTAYARGFGYRDLKARNLVTPDTVFPVASTSKAMNATLLGMLVDEGRVEWDSPVQQYLPRFRLQDPLLSARVTVRDLVTMQTGLPRHDWVWFGSRLTRAELVERIQHLELSADLRQRFQYCNLSVTLAGHIAEVVVGKSWEELVRERIFRPLGMRRSGFSRPLRGDVSMSYHERPNRRLLVSHRFAADVTAPSGGSIHSTVSDMARWVLFNLNKGRTGNRRLVSPKTMAQLHAPQVIVGNRPLAALPADWAYSLGWLVHSYNGHPCVSHEGYLHDVHSSVMLFPGARIGLVSFTNFGCPRLARLINQYVFDALMGLRPAEKYQEWLRRYEAQVKANNKRIASMPRAANTRPSHNLAAYCGEYKHAAYGEIRVRSSGRRLYLHASGLRLPLRHWHYDSWVVEHKAMWPIHQWHAFDSSNPFSFETHGDGNVEALTVRLEPTVAPIRFMKKMRRAA